MALLEICRRRILDQMVGLSRQAGEVAKKSSSGSFCAMVVDDDTLRIISSVCKVYDILDAGVSVIESVEKNRQVLPDVDAIYFLSPCRTSIDRLLTDFKNEKKPQYRSVHIFWSTSIVEDDSLLASIACSPSILPRIKSFVDFNLHFATYESRVFHLDLPNALFKLFPYDRSTGGETVRQMASRLVTVCTTLGGRPRIRFSAEGPFSQLCQDLANQIEAVGSRLSLEGHEFSQTELIILDRSVDPSALLVHEYTYQALAYDVLAIPVCSRSSDISKARPPQGGVDEGTQDDTYQYLDDKKEIQTVLLGEHDDLYVKYRHQHITVVIRGVADELRKFSQDNAAAQYAAAGGKKATERDIASAIRSLPQYREMLAKFWAHITMSENCFNVLQSQGVFKSGALEQDLATGVDKEGKVVQVMNCLSELGRLVAEKSGVITTEKARLLLLYFIQMEGVQTEDRRKMMAAAGLSLDMIEVINRFLALCLHSPSSPIDPVGTSSLKHSHKIHKDEERTQFYQRKAKAAEYELSRYEPAIKDLMERAATKHLSRGRYPYLSDPDATRLAKTRQIGGNIDGDTHGRGGGVRATHFDWDWSGAGNGTQTSATSNDQRDAAPFTAKMLGEGGAKYVFFVIGGITMAEIRTAYEVSRQTGADIYIGGTSIMTCPNLFDMLRRQQEEVSPVHDR